jgi:hypothetical protein
MLFKGVNVRYEVRLFSLQVPSYFPYYVWHEAIDKLHICQNLIESDYRNIVVYRHVTA